MDNISSETKGDYEINKKDKSVGNQLQKPQDLKCGLIPLLSNHQRVTEGTVGRDCGSHVQAQRGPGPALEQGSQGFV